VSSIKASEQEERLQGLQEMAELGGIRVTPQGTESGPEITGFEFLLPIAEHTVLVVDDNEDVLKLYQRYLHSSGYRVATAQTSEEALTLARQIRPDAITLDLMMPEQDGWDLLQRLLHQPDTHHIPIIVCTVLKQKALALSLGATTFLEKPVSRQALLSALQLLEGT
jgi:CheY-like chemotaxis protein